MANNEVVLIDGIIDERLSVRNLQDNPTNRGSEFESFAFNEILKSFDLTEKELENGIVDGSDDGGIDGFYIFVNGVPIIDSSDFAWPKRNAELEIYIIMFPAFPPPRTVHDGFPVTRRSINNNSHTLSQVITMNIF